MSTPENRPDRDVVADDAVNEARRPQNGQQEPGQADDQPSPAGKHGVHSGLPNNVLLGYDA